MMEEAAITEPTHTAVVEPDDSTETTTTTTNTTTEAVIIDTQSDRSDTLDLIQNLLNFPHILDKIFSYLRPKDLRVVPCVSRGWHDACYRIATKANKRRLRSVKHLRKVKLYVGMENWPIDCECANFKRRLRSQRGDDERISTQSRAKRKTLNSIQNVSVANHKVVKIKTNFDGRSSVVDDDLRRKKRGGWIQAKEPFKRW